MNSLFETFASWNSNSDFQNFIKPEIQIFKNWEELQPS